MLYPAQALIGGMQVITVLAEWTQTLHLALGAVIWALAAALVFAAYYEARGAGDGRGRRRAPATKRPAEPTPGERGDRRGTPCAPTSR